MLGMDRSTPGCKTSPQHWLSRNLSPVGRLQVPISRAAGIPWSHSRTGLVSVRGEGRTSPVLMGTGAGSKMSSRRGGTGLSRIMEPTSKAGDLQRLIYNSQKRWLGSIDASGGDKELKQRGRSVSHGCNVRPRVGFPDKQCPKQRGGCWVPDPAGTPQEPQNRAGAPWAGDADGAAGPLIRTGVPRLAAGPATARHSAESSLHAASGGGSG